MSASPSFSRASPAHSQNSSASLASSRLNDLLGLADDSRTLDKLRGDYGLDTGVAHTSPSASATNAMRFLRSLKTSYPEILMQNERLIIATGSPDEQDIRGRQLYPQKELRSPGSGPAKRESPRISAHWAPSVPQSSAGQSTSLSPLSPWSSSSSGDEDEMDTYDEDDLDDEFDSDAPSYDGEDDALFNDDSIASLASLSYGPYPISSSSQSHPTSYPSNFASFAPSSQSNIQFPSQSQSQSQSRPQVHFAPQPHYSFAAPFATAPLRTTARRGNSS